MIEQVREELGGTYRELSPEAEVSCRSVMRWRNRMRQGKSLRFPPGPKKVEWPNLADLLPRLLALSHSRHRTAGTGDLYRRFKEQISRRVLGELICGLRREIFHVQAALQRRIIWNAPGMIWSVDDMEESLSTLGLQVPGLEKAFWDQMRDLSSRHQFEPLVTTGLAPGAVVAERLDKLIRKFGAPLILKRDNHGNLNCEEVDKVLAYHLIIPLNSPPYYPPYNGGIEEAQNEFKTALRGKLRDRAWPVAGPEAALGLLQLASEIVAHDLNERRRPCLQGHSAARIFEVGKQDRRFYYDRRQRREVFDEITAMAACALAETQLTGRRAAAAAWRLAVETWLRREGFITISVGRKVLPYFL